MTVQATILMTKVDGNVPVDGRRTYDVESRTLVFKPRLPILPMTRYRERLPASAFAGSLGSHSISSDYEFTFTTKALEPLLLYVQPVGEPQRRKRLTFTAEAEPYQQLLAAVAARLDLPAAGCSARWVMPMLRCRPTSAIMLTSLITHISFGNS